MEVLELGDFKERPEQGGFTLVEVLMAITLLTLILTATVSALRTFGNTQTSLDRVIGRVDEIRTVSTFLRNAFSATVFVDDMGGLTLGGDTGIEASYFRMKGETVEWRSTAIFGEVYGGSYFFRLSREDDELLLQWQVAKDKIPTHWRNSFSRTLIRNLEEFKLSCWSRNDEDWQKDWDETSIPDKIRLGIRSSSRYWPDLVMRVGG